jgi:hypothetical protein
LIVLPGCTLLATPSLQLVPRSWRKNHPWGPQANELRAQGQLAYRKCTPQLNYWAEFARQHIEDGDIVFRRGRSCLMPVFDVSKLLAHISDSPYSHCGIAHWEGDSVWIYDMEDEGFRKQPFEIWMLDVVDDLLAIKRLPESARGCIPQVLSFCEEHYHQHIKFDMSLRLDDEAFYCTEMVEKAYRSAGIKLSDPVPICCLPNYSDYPVLAAILPRLTRIRLEEPVFAIGNESYGIFSSPCLETVYEHPEASNPKRTHHRPPNCMLDATDSGLEPNMH